MMGSLVAREECHRTPHLHPRTAKQTQMCNFHIGKSGYRRGATIGGYSGATARFDRHRALEDKTERQRGQSNSEIEETPRIDFRKQGNLPPRSSNPVIRMARSRDHAPYLVHISRRRRGTHATCDHQGQLSVIGEHAYPSQDRHRSAKNNNHLRTRPEIRILRPDPA